LYPTLPDSPEKVNCSKSSPIVSDECVLEFSADEASQCLELKCAEALAQGPAAQCLPRLTVTKSVLDHLAMVNESLNKVSNHSDPSL